MSRLSLAIACICFLLTGCNDNPEIPFDPGKCHRVSEMSAEQRNKAMAWKRWKNQPMNALYDAHAKAGLGESSIKEKPGKIYCPKNMTLSWDLDKVGTAPLYTETLWTAHCYWITKDKTL